MTSSKDTIIEIIRERADHPMKIKELAAELGIPATRYASFRRTVKAMIDSGELVRLKKNRIGLAAAMDIVVGILSLTRSGIGFIIREGETEDILIPAVELHTALDGDKVMARLTGLRHGRKAGTIIRVVARSGRNIVGVFRKGGSFLYVKPDSPRIHRDIYIPTADTRDAKDGEKVVVKLTCWDDPYRNPEGKVIERIGFPGSPGVDMLTVIRNFNLAEEFSPEVIAEAENAASDSLDDEIKQRTDFTQDCIYTIDPADAKDHDDAVSVEKTETGFRLGVHIADVSYYVQPGTEIDREAFARGNSVYLPGRVVPMLPVVLSNDVCSLKVNKTRLAHSVLIDFDRKGKVLKWKRLDSVIRSKAKLSYEQVEDFFKGNTDGIRSRPVKSNLSAARELAVLLSKRRFSQGSLDFDLPESTIVLDEKGDVLELRSKVRMESHRLVEEFMLVANQVMALEVFRAGQKMLYRVHDRPDSEKLQEFSSMMSRLGYSFPVSRDMKPIQFSRFLKDIENVPEADFINELLLRSMKKAVYQRENIGHFGLAFSHYTHFTSPIRRYPDLLIHRLLRYLKDGRYPVSFARRAGSVIDTVGKHCSETERVAERAERQAIKVKQVAYMARHVGDEFNGVITGVTGHGFYVRIDRMGVEGMVRVSTLDDDYYRFDESRYCLTGRRNNKVYRLGDKLAVGVLKVDKERSEIDLHVAIKQDKRAPRKQKPSAARKSVPGKKTGQKAKKTRKGKKKRPRG